MSEETPQLSFEQGLEKLEGIVKQLEQGEIPLEESLRLFENGVRLSRSLREQLDAAEAKVEILMKKGGEHVPQPFELGNGG